MPHPRHLQLTGAYHEHAEVSMPAMQNPYGRFRLYMTTRLDLPRNRVAGELGSGWSTR
jgi:hypothetical protein